MTCGLSADSRNQSECTEATMSLTIRLPLIVYGFQCSILSYSGRQEPCVCNSRIADGYHHAVRSSTIVLSLQVLPPHLSPDSGVALDGDAV
eukprot:1188402-Rhodomonas_salina.1